MCLHYDGIGVLQRSEHRVDPTEVTHVVPAISHRRGIPRCDPNPVDAQVGQIWEPSTQAGEITLTVAVAVSEAARVDLVDDGVAPPETFITLCSVHLRTVPMSLVSKPKPVDLALD